MSTTNTPQVYAAMNAVQASLAKHGISKDRKNAQQGYAFRGIDDIYNTLATLIAENKLCIIPRTLGRIVTERETKAGGALFYVVVDMEFDFVSSVDGSKHTARMAGEAMDSGDKATNKAQSAAYKYVCLQTFCIPTEGDNDADGQTHEVVSTPTVKPAKTQGNCPTERFSEPPKHSGVPRDPVPSGSGADWRECPVPKFVKKGMYSTVGDMPESDRSWWQANYVPKPFKGSISQGDVDFKDALDAWKAEINLDDPPF